MRRYFKNIIRALMGKEPSNNEPEQETDEYRHVKEHDLGQDGLCRPARSRIAKTGKKVASLELLVENLRQRLREKDMLLEQTKKSYQERINNYNLEIEELRTGQNNESVKQ